MKKNILAVSFLSLMAIAVFATASNALAYKGQADATGPNCSPERHTAMEKAFENNDYAAWKNLMQGKGRVTQIINEQNFSQFAQMHKLNIEGKTDEASKIRKELGLGLKNGAGQNQGTRNGNTTK